MVTLSAGLLDVNKGWEILLDQIGMRYKKLISSESNEQHSVIIAGDTITKESSDAIERHLKNGGSLLISAKGFASLSGTATKTMAVRSLFGACDSIFSDTGLLDIFSELSIHPKANALPSLEGKHTLFLGEYNGGNIAVLPFSAGNLLEDTRVEKKSFYATERRLPFERVSLLSKGALRRLVYRTLEHLHTKASLPFVHTWHLPETSATYFSFRIDTDYSDKPGIERLYMLCERYGVSATWFTDVKSQESFLDYFTGMKNQEIGIHCYEHASFDNVESNYSNIGKAKELFIRANLPVRGFAAPYGAWNTGIAKAIQKHGFEYSSEFSYDYDNLPSAPYVEEQACPLQIPTHPISIGTLQRLGYTDDMMIRYFRSVIEEKIALREPVILYHHPNDRHEAVLETIFTIVREHTLPMLNFNEIASRWKERSQQNNKATLEGNSLTIYSAGAFNLPLRIVMPSGKEMFVSKPATIQLSPETGTPQAQQYCFPEKLLRIRKFNPWISIIKIQDETIGKLKKIRRNSRTNRGKRKTTL